MKPTERFVVYGALAGLAIAMVLQLPASTAIANRLAGDLGPADALILTGKDSNLTIKNGNGRVQWGTQATATAWSVGAVNSDKLMKALLKSPRLDEQRTALRDEATAKDEDFRKRYKDLSEKYKDVDQSSPNFEDARREMDAFIAEANEWQKAINGRFTKLQAEQIEGAYRDLTAAVDLIAERQKIDIVMRFVPTAAKFDQDRPKSANEDEEDAMDTMNPVLHSMDQIRARTFLHYPESIDITAEVMKELGLKDE